MFKINLENIKFSIRIITYPRNGKTKYILPKTLESILNQSYKNWEIYLFGDNYIPEKELIEISKLIPKEKLKLRNLDVDSERYHYKGMDLWYCGGVNACNYVLDWMQEDNVKYVALCNDDDIWLKNHLETLAFAYDTWPESSFVYTRGNHLQMGNLPIEQINHIDYNNKPVTEHDTIFSAVSWRLDRINLRFQNCVKEQMPSDADLWIRTKEYCFNNDLKFLYIPKITVMHESHKPDEHNEIENIETNVDALKKSFDYTKYKFKSKKDLLF
jgi:glycosyltransferase involved in cell wall biosynthesis